MYKDMTMINNTSGKSTFFVAISSLIIAMVIALSGFAEAGEAKSASSPPAQFVQRLGDTTLMSLTAKNVSRATREERVRKILRNNFDVPAIGRFAMGTYWKDASEAQRKEYMV